MIACYLEGWGLEVKYEHPTERLSGDPRQIFKIVYWVIGAEGSEFVGGTTFALASNAVKRLHERFPAVRAKVERDPSEPM